MFKKPLYYCITDRRTSREPLWQQLERNLAAGVRFIQIREKELSGRQLFQLAAGIKKLASIYHARVMLNDRLDIVLAAGLDGVHLSGASVETAVLRERLAGRPLLIGVSAHSAEEIRKAAAAGADYAVFGPVFSTPSKTLLGQPQGVGKLREAVQAASIPVLALGGVDSSNYRDCLEAGAAGVAAIRFFQDPALDLADLIKNWN